jgi:hypothetical protein
MEAISNIRNIYLDSLPAKAESEKAVKLIRKFNDEVQQVSRKQIYLVKSRHTNPYYIMISSAPSNLKLSLAIKGIMKEYGKYPLYIFFTRDVNTYPKSCTAYWQQVKRLYKQRGFCGAIMGLNSYTAEISKLMNLGQKIRMDYREFVTMAKNKPDLLSVLNEFGVRGKKAKLFVELFEIINK